MVYALCFILYHLDFSLLLDKGEKECIASITAQDAMGQRNGFADRKDGVNYRPYGCVRATGKGESFEPSTFDPRPPASPSSF